ncbi:hypothetical protein [Priestia aryabhattai]
MLCPFEEIDKLNDELKEVKETLLDGTDAEYFGTKQLTLLIERLDGVKNSVKDILKVKSLEEDK